MNRHEEVAFDAQVKSLADKHDVPVSYAGFLARSILHLGMSEPDMWLELEQYCEIWNRSNENG